MVVKMNMANSILRWLLLKLRVPSFVVYETALEKRAMTRTKAPELTFLWVEPEWSFWETVSKQEHTPCKEGQYIMGEPHLQLWDLYFFLTIWR